MIMVIGGSGAVGQLLAHHWAELKTPIVMQYRHSTVPDVGLKTLVWNPDEGHDHLVAWAEVHGCPQTLIVLAGVTPRSGLDLNLNTLIAKTCLAAAEAAGVKRVLLASSSAVYGVGYGTPFSESHATAPVNPYGEAKLMMEQSCNVWRDRGMEVCCLRIGNVAGADALLLNAANSPIGVPLIIDQFADGGGPVRSYIGAGTLARVLYDLATCPDPLPSTVNIATPGFVAMEELAKAANHPYTLRVAPENAHQWITLDCSRLAALHGFTPEASTASEMITQWKVTLSS